MNGEISPLSRRREGTRVQRQGLRFPQPLSIDRPAARHEHRGLTAGFARRDAGYYPVPLRQELPRRVDRKLSGVLLPHRDAGTPWARRSKTFRPEMLDTHRKKIEQVSAVLDCPRTLYEGMPSSSQSQAIASRELGRRSRRCDRAGPDARDTQLAGRRQDHITPNEAPGEEPDRVSSECFDDHLDGHHDPRSSRRWVISLPPRASTPMISLPMEVKPDGTMVCRFVMPFAKSARIEVTNKGNEAVRLSYLVFVPPHTWDPKPRHALLRPMAE